MSDTSTLNPPLTRQWREYYQLCKPKVVALIVFTAVVGMLLAPADSISLLKILTATIGIGLASASAAAINHVADHRIDALMDRTRERPLVQGGLSRAQALMFATAIGGFAMLVLTIFNNGITAVLTFASLIGYAVIYTMYLKRATPQNIVIGGAAGAAPPVLGWTAMTGTVDPHSLLLFLIIFAWTPPHFWALAIYRRKEYAKADIPMLPVTHGVDFTRLQILLYTIIMIACSVLPFACMMSGWIYFAGVTALNAVFLYYAVRLFTTEDDKVAIRTFVFSIFYLMGVFALLFIDRYYDLVRGLISSSGIS